VYVKWIEIVISSLLLSLTFKFEAIEKVGQLLEKI